jgi:uncharacterized spore protein YtfJ
MDISNTTKRLKSMIKVNVINNDHIPIINNELALPYSKMGVGGTVS